MQEGQLLMTQADRDRLVALKKAKKNLITPREAAAELDVSIRQVQRLLKGLKQQGDKAVVHGLRREPSNRKIEEEIEQQAVQILSGSRCMGGVRGGAGLGSWCNGTPANMTGGKGGARSCT
jgi:transposase